LPPEADATGGNQVDDQDLRQSQVERPNHCATEPQGP